MTTTNATSFSNNCLDNKTVAIVGGGPGGLTLARLLQMRGAHVRVYERDASPTLRGQGGSLDLHEDSGQLALREAGLGARFSELARPQGQQSRIFDKHGTLLLEMRAEHETQTRPEIDRGELRDMLLNALASDTVSWDRSLRQLVMEKDGRYRLDFTQGFSADADVVVGCDGTWSKVRPYVSPLQPGYGGVTFIETHIHSPNVRYPRLAAWVGQGSALALGDNRALMAQCQGNGDIRIYVALRVPENWVNEAGIDFKAPAQARVMLLDYFADWSPDLTDLLRVSDDVFLPRPLYTVAADQSWPSQSGVTLLGDAAHVMPPFTGRGVNMAMLDAVALADCLTSGRHSTVGEAIAAYERSMFSRMSEAIRETLAAQDRIIAEGAPDRVVAVIRDRLNLDEEGAQE